MSLQAQAGGTYEAPCLATSYQNDSVLNLITTENLIFSKFNYTSNSGPPHLEAMIVDHQGWVLCFPGSR